MYPISVFKLITDIHVYKLITDFHVNKLITDIHVYKLISDIHVYLTTMFVYNNHFMICLFDWVLRDTEIVYRAGNQNCVVSYKM
jgi:hypothetical protein